MQGDIGQINLFAGEFAPVGWALCHGQLLSITQHEELFAVIGTRYGGDAKATFALPDLRDRPAVGAVASRPRRGRRPDRPGTPVQFVICLVGSFPTRP